MPATSVWKGKEPGEEAQMLVSCLLRWPGHLQLTQKSSNGHLVAVLGHAARCLRGDVLGDGHGGHGLQRRRVRPGEAAAHTLVDGTIPGEAAVLCQCTLLAAHWRESVQSFKSKPSITGPVLHTWDSRHRVHSGIDKSSGCHFFCNLRKSYCWIWESLDTIQLHKEGKTEEELLQLISLSPLLVPVTETKENGSKPVWSKQEEAKRKNITLSEESPFIFYFLSSASGAVGPPSGVHLYQLLDGLWRLSRVNPPMLSSSTPTFRFVTFPLMQQIITKVVESRCHPPSILTMDAEINPEVFVSR